MIVETLIVVLILEILLFILWKYEKIIRAPTTAQYETDLRLTYKRYKELYPNATLSYREYKQLQARRAYKKAVSSMSIKRMVR